jgi:hypothetical protein
MACFLKIVEPKKGNSSNFTGLFSQINLEIIANWATKPAS